MRSGKISSVLEGNELGIETPDNSNYVTLFFQSDTEKLCVKKSTGAVLQFPDEEEE